MFRYLANGNYLVKENFGVFDNNISADQLRQRNNWVRQDATDPKIDCISFTNPKPCIWIEKESKPCTVDEYGFKTCEKNMVCGNKTIKATSACNKTGPICFRKKRIEDKCCPHQTTDYAKSGNVKYCLWKKQR
jgi:hypothetical protein